jgi:hypothetical protein
MNGTRHGLSKRTYTPAELAEKFALLEAFRRKRDWSYDELSRQIELVTDRHRDPDCLRKLCQGLTKGPHSRTVALLDDFLAEMLGTGRRRRVS